MLIADADAEMAPPALVRDVRKRNDGGGGARGEDGVQG